MINEIISSFSSSHLTILLSYRLDLEFHGILNDELRGLYRSTYKVDGETRIMATTQFEATDARRAFPCWDEPAMKGG